ncbi:MAG: ABC transporter permease [Burkholderiales bacterium]|nr:ABC transporter permease [Burkholderiales bacterium]
MGEASSWLQFESGNGTGVLRLRGVWRLSNLGAIAGALQSAAPEACDGIVLDGSGLEALDTAAGFILCRHLEGAGCAGSMMTLRGFDPRHEKLIDLVRQRMTCPPVAARASHRDALSRIGVATLDVLRMLRVHVGFVGVVASELLALLRRPKLFRFKETVSQFETICLDAIPIAALVTFLIGVVFAYLLGLQTQRYGANIFVVDGVGLAVCRELAPLLVAVIVAGRSGAAFTAQIGTMKVQEEIDAISVLGLSPVQVLVIPRLVAIMAALPLLVFVGDLAGLAGGMLVASWQLDISVPSFIERLHGVLPLSAPVVGLVKAPVFAAFIAMIACRMGMLVARDARSVGLNTTSTVVQSIVWVIVLDAVFAIVFQHLGI